ncbi:ABC transporter substrate-binding protein, partial [Streptomyces sp. NPDC002537]
MKLRKTAAAAVVVVALAASACGKSGSPDDKSDKAGDGSSAPSVPAYKVNTAADVKGSPVFEKIKGKKITIGTKADQPG